MKFNTGLKKYDYPNHNGTEYTLSIEVKSVLPVSLREQAMEVYAEFSALLNKSDIIVKDGEVSAQEIEITGDTAKALSKCLTKIYGAVAQMLVKWNAEDDNGEMAINPDTVAFVLGENICAEVIGDVINPTKAGNSRKASNSSEMSSSPSLSEAEKSA